MGLADPKILFATRVVGKIRSRWSRGGRSVMERGRAAWCPRSVCHRAAELRSIGYFHDTEPQLLGDLDHAALCGGDPVTGNAPVETGEMQWITRRGLRSASRPCDSKGDARARSCSDLTTAPRLRQRRSDAPPKLQPRHQRQPGGVVGQLAPHGLVYRGPQAADHLFRVAAGSTRWSSEKPQILGQVKDAFAMARGSEVHRARSPKPQTGSVGVQRRQAGAKRNGSAKGAGGQLAAFSYAKKIRRPSTG